MIPAPQLQPSGQMTRVMRAIAQHDLATPRVLRVGVVQGGRVVEERMVGELTRVTVGASERATVVIPGALREHALFARGNDGWVLRVTAGMTGRVALTSGIHDLRSDVEIPLSNEARGKIVIGETTILFQFVVPPPPKTRPQLPLAVRGGLAGSIDWTLTVIAAFSFMFHFGFIGAMYSDWLDEPVPEVSVAGLVDLTRNLPPAPPPVDVVDTTPTSAPSATTPAPKTANATTPSSQHGTTAAQSASDRRAALMTQDAQAMGMQLIGAFQGDSAVKGALDRSNVPLVDLTPAAESSSGAQPITGSLVLNDGHPIMRPGDTSLQHLGKNDLGPQTVQTARPVDGPRYSGEAVPGPIAVSAPVANAEATIAKLRPSFRSCYQQKGLANDPSMAGKIVIRIDIAPNGDVKSVSKTSGSGLSPAVEQCIMAKVQTASFDAPGGGGSKLDVPVSFINTTK